MRRLVLGLAGAALLCGCQAARAAGPPRGEVVFGADPHEIIVTSDRRVAGACHALGHERVWAIGPDLMRSAIASMKRRAAERRGNLVVSDGPQAVLAGGPKAARAGSYVEMSADIYLC